MTIDMPYFLTNKKWYEINPKYDMLDEVSTEPQYILTGEATIEAIESYQQYLEDVKAMNAQYTV